MIAGALARRKLESSLRVREAEQTSTLITDVSVYESDPVGYARDVLGFNAWDDGTENSQAMFMAAVPFAKRIANRSGHKTGKSGGLSAIAWWWFDTKLSAGRSPKVILTAPTHKQVGEVIWSDVRKLGRHARRRLPGKIYISPSSGIRGPNEAKIVAYVAKSAEAFSGPSSADMLIIVDEAAGIEPAIYEAIEGMAAAGATVIFAFNPTSIVGPSYDAFHRDRDRWLKFHFDSEKVATFLGPIDQRPPELRGLANLEWVHERRAAWGETDARYLVRVKGEYPTTDARASVPAHVLLSSMSAPFANEVAQRRVRVELGVDVARYGDDKTAIACRQGGYVRIRSRGGLDGNAIAAWVVETICVAQTGNITGPIDRHCPKPIVRIDGNGVGAAVVDALNKHPSRQAFTLVDVNASQRAIHAHQFANARAEGAFRLRDFLMSGGVLENDDETREDIAAMLYKFDAKQRLLIEDKDEIKKRIGRSPDKGDAAVLSVYDSTEVAGMSVNIINL